MNGVFSSLSPSLTSLLSFFVNEKQLENQNKKKHRPCDWLLAAHAPPTVARFPETAVLIGWRAGNGEGRTSFISERIHADKGKEKFEPLKEEMRQSLSPCAFSKKVEFPCLLTPTPPPSSPPAHRLPRSCLQSEMAAQLGHKQALRLK